MKVVIETIPHKDQRYDTCGDWWWAGDTLQMRLSDLGDWRKEMCVAIHELFEALACKQAGVSQESVDAFDIQFEKDRKEKGWDKSLEAGDDPRAPYFKQHQAAINPEMWLAYYLDLDWKDYIETLENLE